MFICIYIHVGHPIDLCKVQPLQGQALGSSLGVVTPRPASANNGSCNLWMDVHFPQNPAPWVLSHGYMCVYIYIYIYIYRYIYIHIWHIYICVCVCVCVHVYNRYVYVYVYVYIYNKYIYMYIICVYIYSYVMKYICILHIQYLKNLWLFRTFRSAS